MKIVYVLEAYFPRAVGGTEMYTDALANDVREMGHEVCLVIPDFHNTGTGSYIYNNIEVHTYKEPSRGSRNLILGFEKPAGLDNFSQLIKQLNPDIVHFQMISAGQGITMFHLESVKMMGFRTVLTIHLSHYTCLTGNLIRNNEVPCDGVIKDMKCSICYMRGKEMSAPLASLSAGLSNLAMRLLNKSEKLYSIPFLGAGMHVYKRKEDLKKLAEYSDMICAITGWYKDMLIKNGVPEEKLRLVKQGAIGPDGKNHPADDQEYKAVDTGEHKKVKLVFIGRITRVKGLHVLLEALKGLDNKLYDLDIFGLIGDGNKYQEDNARYILANGISATFRGAIPHEEILRILSGYDVLCLPSLFSEMSPLVIQEAFKAGIPVIGSEAPGISEEVKNGVNGYIFPFGNVGKLREQLSTIFEDRSLILRLKKNVVAPRNFKRVSEETVLVYEEIINPDMSRSGYSHEYERK